MEKQETTKILQKLESELNDFEINKKSLEILPSVIKNRKERVYIINKAMEFLDDAEKRVIQRTCIDGVSPRDLEQEFKHKYRKIYIDKEEALKKLARLMYGLELWEGDNKNDSKMY